MEWLAGKTARDAAEADLRAEADAKAAEEAKSKSANSSRMGSRGAGRGRPRPESLGGSDSLGRSSPATPAAASTNPVSTPAKAGAAPGPGQRGAGSTSGGGGGGDEQDIQLITEGSYTEINELYGLTGERVMRFELVGVGRERVAQLRSLFISLDEDGGGELGPLELYEALVKFGQNVTDKQVKEMMDEVDQDNSGSIGFEEFLKLAVPGASSGGPKVKRNFAMQRYIGATYEDTVGQRPSGVDRQSLPLKIPVQCFSKYNPDLEFLPEHSRSTQPTVEQPTPAAEDGTTALPVEQGSGVFPVKEGARVLGSHNNEQSRQAIHKDGLPVETLLEMRLRFKMVPNQRVSQMASKGNIETQLAISRNCWTPKKYLFGKKQLAPRDGKGAGIVFTVPDGSDGENFPGPPTNKILCVQFPGKKKVIELFAGCPTLYGFPIVQITTKSLRITFEIPFGESYKSLSNMADFPPPIEYVTILSCGAGALLSSLRTIVAAESFLPPWYPFSFSTMCPDELGKPRRIDLKHDLGELENLPKGSVCLDVYLNRDELPKCLVTYDAVQYSWIGDMESIDYTASTNVLTEIAFRGGSVNLLELAKPLRLGVRMMEQVDQASWRSNRGWISCPPHPHVMTLLVSANANIFVSPYLEGVSGDMIADILNASLLNEKQRRIIFIKVGLQVAWALEHMHSHDIWHLDLKPSNLIITLDVTDPEKPRFWQQIHVRVCDYSRCSAHNFANMFRRGTVGYWSPEQVHNRVDPTDEPSSDLYWGLKECKDPPPPSLADMTEKSDSWGWATMMLGLMGRLDEMRKTGYQAFIHRLLDKGFIVDLSAIFVYEQQAFIDLVQSELDEVKKVYAKIKKAWTKLSEEIEKQCLDKDPVWQTAVKALENLTDKDLNQLKGHRKISPTLKLLNESIGAILEIERKNVSDWARFRELVASSEFVTTALKFAKDQGLPLSAAKDLARCFRNPAFQIEAFVESSVPNSDPASPGSALDVAAAYFQWVVAVNEFNLLRKVLAPIQMEMKQREDEMKRLDPKVSALDERIAVQKAELDVLKARLNTNNRAVLEVVRTADKDTALEKIRDILEMGNTLTNQQFTQLQNDCLYCTGDHSQVFRVLAWLNRLPPDSTIRLGQPQGNIVRVFSGTAPSLFAASVKTVMDDLYDKFECLRATRPKDEHVHHNGAAVNDSMFSRVGSGASELSRHSASQFHQQFSSAIEEDEEEASWDHFPSTGAGMHYVYEKAGDVLPAQHKRHEMLGRHSTEDGVGDALSLVLAWCLQHQPIDRLGMSGVAAVLMQLSPGQEWLHKVTQHTATLCNTLQHSTAHF